jgi:putative FmdB family regulatory protein
VPTYQYACTACDHRFEAVQKFTDDSLTVCPECAGALRKIYGSVGVVFKGSGWYRTDSRGGPVPPNGEAAKTGDNTGSAEKSGDKAPVSTSSSSSSSGSSSNGSGSSGGGTGASAGSKSGTSSAPAKKTTSAVPA